MNSGPHYKLIDLFSGCGGMTAGFRKAGGFTPVFANDYNDWALDSYRANFDPEHAHSVGGDITRLLDEGEIKVPKADVVIGGPPCQGFSLLNKKRTGDPRRTLWYQFMRVVEKSGAGVFVMENVPQLLGSDEFLQIRACAEAMGFTFIQAKVLNSADYGVPEVRRRAIILASKYAPISLPRPTYADPAKLDVLSNGETLFEFTDIQAWRDVRSAIGDLPPPEGTEPRSVPPPLDLHFGRNPTRKSLERYHAVPRGGNRFDLQRNRPDLTPDCWVRKKSGGTDLFGRLWWDRPSVTIRTEFFKPEKGRYLHPEQNRPITHREAARIQSFDDEFTFIGSKIEIARQIGNAVPPLLAKAIAHEVLNCLQGTTQSSYVAETEAMYTVLKNGKIPA